MGVWTGKKVVQAEVSIVVPVYGVESYLPRCLDSLCRQSMPAIEIILVDDASPDRCGEICEEYAAKDPRVSIKTRGNKFYNICNNGRAYGNAKTIDIWKIMNRKEVH